ncbi:MULTISPECIES: DUF4097 family beta strand repeat-containing protein [Methanoculleus]|uniref:DUF4097 domain-containing protein n=2 Tax=Methanoculleus TaxID=45989 RepID=A3CS25_METMJ|nr:MULTISPECIES: DUF4097 family beta strand repeat-containing protein [Methanoculleus]ABN56175.1 hypothetical protein Memar_0241 [Methanoculleus marisnigri JR1]MCC7555161.1 DUF4097 domain-containing protein [Methanoculleus marisnigri]UYU17643.1 DUF4097 domain-containing protein [Methanoculleus submarinus]
MQGTVYAVLALAVLATVIAGCTGVPGVEETEQFDRTVAVEPESGIVVINHNGNVAVNVREGEDVGITAVKRSVYGRGELEKVRIEVTEGDPLRVETVHTTFDPRVSVDYTISLPPTVVLQRIESSNGGIELSGVRLEETELLTSNGRIEIRGAEGYVTATTSNAGITVEDCGGIAGLATSNGEVTAELSAVRGDVTVSSSNAGITLRFAEDLDARVVATTSNGGITVHDLMLRLEESTGTSVSGTLGNGGPTVTVKTSNAGIDLFGP